MPGVIAGCILVYAGAITAYVTQTLIGSAQLLYMPLAIYQQAIGARTTGRSPSAMSVIFMAAVLIVVYFLNMRAACARKDLCQLEAARLPTRYRSAS